ncbi:MAG: hypothetical protein J0L84_15360, partial [Verrucomicrobia bacterium]|nr:hypothetical protein [Verrucomicrobiota bacterium]
DGSRILLEYEVRPGWAYTLLGLPFDRMHESGAAWNTLVGEKTATAFGTETTRLSPDEPAHGQALRVEARSTSPR